VLIESRFLLRFTCVLPCVPFFIDCLYDLLAFSNNLRAPSNAVEFEETKNSQESHEKGSKL
jgi:hypothetical protein